VDGPQGGLFWGGGLTFRFGRFVVLCWIFHLRRRRRSGILQELPSEATAMFWEMKKVTMCSAVAQAYDFPFATNAPRRFQATNADDSPILFCELRDARGAGGAVDKLNAVDEEALGDTVREVFLPARLGGLPRVIPATVDDVVKYSGVPPALSEFGVGACLHGPSDLLQTVQVSKHGFWGKRNLQDPLDEVVEQI